jgi:hypothetical protein
MVQDRNGNVARGFTNGMDMPGKTKNGVVRKSTQRTFDSVRSTSSVIFSANSSGAEDTGIVLVFLSRYSRYNNIYVLKLGKVFKSLAVVTRRKYYVP